MRKEYNKYFFELESNNRNNRASRAYRNGCGQDPRVRFFDRWHESQCHVSGIQMDTNPAKIFSPSFLSTQRSLHMEGHVTYDVSTTDTLACLPEPDLKTCLTFFPVNEWVPQESHLFIHWTPSIPPPQLISICKCIFLFYKMNIYFLFFYLLWACFFAWLFKDQLNGCQGLKS